MTIQFSHRFNKELDSQLDFILKDGYDRAVKFYNELMQTIALLEQNPKMGRDSQKHKDLQEIIYKGYVIPYFYDGDKTVTVLGIYGQNIWDI